MWGEQNRCTGKFPLETSPHHPNNLLLLVFLYTTMLYPLFKLPYNKHGSSHQCLLSGPWNPFQEKVSSKLPPTFLSRGSLISLKWNHRTVWQVGANLASIKPAKRLTLSFISIKVFQGLIQGEAMDDNVLEQLALLMNFFPSSSPSN